MADSSYVVQVKREGSWVDLATIQVLPRTHRETIIRKALADWKGENGPEIVRVLDAKAAHETTVTLKPREPELRID